MVDRRNRTRWQLNRLAHRLLQVTGEVGRQEIAASRERRFSVGDRVVARIGERTLHPVGRPADYVRNGATGTVVALREQRDHTGDRIVVAFDHLGQIELPRSFFDERRGSRSRMEVGLDHAYAVTSYAVQGSTFTESTSRIDEKASRSETYVDITRGRSANHLYLTRSIDPLDGESLPRAPSPPIEVSVGTRLAGSGPERAAIDIDPAAPSALDVPGRQGSPPLPDSTVTKEMAPAVERSRRRAARLGPSRLEPAVAGRLPPRSDLPFLARRWDETASALYVFLQRWEITPGGPGRWDWALGPRGDDPERDQERSHVAAGIVELAVATLKEAMRSEAIELPPWARPHLVHHAALGVCVQDPQRLRELYQRIEAYRRDAGIGKVEQPADAAEAILGPPPEDAVVRMRRMALVEETLPRRPGVTRERASRVPA